jgi:hypothetical protein
MKNLVKFGTLVAGLAISCVLGLVILALVAPIVDADDRTVALVVSCLIGIAGTAAAWLTRAPGQGGGVRMDAGDRAPKTIDAADLARAVRDRRRGGPSTGASDAGALAAVAIMAAAIVVVLVWTSAGCSGTSLRSDAPETTARYARLACGAVDAVCGADVLPPAVQSWCATASAACTCASVVAVAVVGELAPPKPGDDVGPMLAVSKRVTGWRPLPPILADDWRAACAYAPELAQACAAWAEGGYDGLAFEPAP